MSRIAYPIQLFQIEGAKTLLPKKIPPSASDTEILLLMHRAFRSAGYFFYGADALILKRLLDASQSKSKLEPDALLETKALLMACVILLSPHIRTKPAGKLASQGFKR